MLNNLSHQYQYSSRLLQVSQALDEHANKLTAEDRSKARAACDDTIRWMDSNQMAEKEEFEDKYKELEKVCQTIMRKIHEPAASQSCGNQNTGGFAQGNYPSSGPTVEEVD